jgi:hypothetical protein
MKPWLRLTLTLVGLALVCLLLNLTQAVALNHPLQTVGLGPRLDRGGKAASDAPSSSLVRCMEFDPARVASLVLDRALRAGNISPPGEKTHGPPEPMGRGRAADQAGNSNHRHRAIFSAKLLAFNPELKNRGFATAFS